MFFSRGTIYNSKKSVLALELNVTKAVDGEKIDIKNSGSGG